MMLNLRKMAKRDLQALMAILLVLGYIDIGAIALNPTQFELTLRGPIFWRLTSGIKPRMNPISKGPAAKAYLNLEALLAYLLLIDEAYVVNGAVGASTIVGTVSSDWFRWTYLEKVLRENRVSFWRNRLIMMVLNLVIGLSLYNTESGMTLTALFANIDQEIGFVATAVELAREPRRLPSLLTPPIRNPQLYLINKFVGGLLMAQQLRIRAVYMARGGELGFAISGDMLRLKALPQIMKQKMAEATRNGLRE